MCECVCECVSVSMCVFSLCPGMPFLHRPHTLYSIPQGGPGLCVSGECQGERTAARFQMQPVQIQTERDRKREKIQRLRDPCLIEGVASSLVRPANEQKVDVDSTHRKIHREKKKVSSGYNICNKKEKKKLEE